MPTFAVIDESVVINLIVAETKADAEEATGKTCVESTDTNQAIIGLGYSNGNFEKPVATEEPTE